MVEDDRRERVSGRLGRWLDGRLLISLGEVVVPGDQVILPSLRQINERGPRRLAIDVVGVDPGPGARCASTPIFIDGVDGGLGACKRPTTNR